MPNNEEVISQVLLTAKKAGLSKIAPIILSEGGNLIIHLSPHPIVARVATVISGENPHEADQLLTREMRVAKHLQNSGVPVLLPTEEIDAGPHCSGGLWMTFWRYITFTNPQLLTPSDAVHLVNILSTAMKDLPYELPVLGVWEKVCQSAERLEDHSNPMMKSIVTEFHRVDDQIRMIQQESLVPSHGDAHPHNLLPSTDGWLWMDFEDASLMPPYWDLASMIANPVLFGGSQEPTYRYILEQTNPVTDSEDFEFTLTAQILMSTIGNLDLALQGHGDLDFATRQLDLLECYLEETKRT